jgi:hypothetical protein
MRALVKKSFGPWFGHHYDAGQYLDETKVKESDLRRLDDLVSQGLILLEGDPRAQKLDSAALQDAVQAAVSADMAALRDLLGEIRTALDDSAQVLAEIRDRLVSPAPESPGAAIQRGAAKRGKR